MKNLIYFILLSVININPVFSLGINIQNVQAPIILSNNIKQNALITYTSQNHTKIFIKPLENNIKNIQNPNIEIPITNLYVIGSNEKKQLSNNLLTQITTNNSYANNLEAQLPVLFSIENIGILPSGTYTTSLEISNVINYQTPSEQTYTTVYLLTFQIPDNLNIISNSPYPIIHLSEDDIYSKNNEILNTNDTIITIQANSPWKLFLDTNGIGNLSGDYYFFIKNKSNITNYLQQKTKLQPNSRYLLAWGDSTISNFPNGQYKNVNLSLQYSFKNTSNNYLPEGILLNQLKYVIEKN